MCKDVEAAIRELRKLALKLSPENLEIVLRQARAYLARRSGEETASTRLER